MTDLLNLAINHPLQFTVGVAFWSMMLAPIWVPLVDWRK